MKSPGGKTRIIRCDVPGCGRSWFLSGQRQGFQASAAYSHISAHWRKRHVEERHPQWDPETGLAIDRDPRKHTKFEKECNFCTTLLVGGFKPRKDCLSCEGSGKLRQNRAKFLSDGAMAVGYEEIPCSCTRRSMRTLLKLRPRPW